MFVSMPESVVVQVQMDVRRPEVAVALLDLAEFPIGHREDPREQKHADDQKSKCAEIHCGRHLPGPTYAFGSCGPLPGRLLIG